MTTAKTLCYRCGNPTARPEYSLCFPCDYQIRVGDLRAQGRHQEADRTAWFARMNGIDPDASPALPTEAQVEQWVNELYGPPR